MRRTPIGQRSCRIALQNPGTPVPDGDGGYSSTWTNLSPSHMWARIEPASTNRLERVTAGTVQSTASHIVTMPYHSGVTTKTRVVFGVRTFTVTGVSNPNERNIETVCVCSEVVA